MPDKADIAYESENVSEEKTESIKEYDPDQGGRIQNKYITEEMANKYFAMFWEEWLFMLKEARKEGFF